MGNSKSSQPTKVAVPKMRDEPQSDEQKNDYKEVAKKRNNSVKMGPSIVFRKYIKKALVLLAGNGKD